MYPVLCDGVVWSYDVFGTPYESTCVRGRMTNHKSNEVALPINTSMMRQRETNDMHRYSESRGRTTRDISCGIFVLADHVTAHLDRGNAYMSIDTAGI